MRVAISGFGRIGKSFLKAAIEQGALGKDFQVVAINTRSGVEQHAHLFRYDTVYGRFDGKAEVKNGNLVVNGHEIRWINETDPLKLPWKDLGVDLVLDSSGTFRSRAAWCASTACRPRVGSSWSRSNRAVRPSGAASSQATC